MAAATVINVADPKFIKYLLDPAANYDCYIAVGNASVAPVEKIGVVPKMLFAHSEVMRSDLQVKNINDKVPYEIVDILPHTFKNLLRFVYGHDTSSTLSFDEADNLLYAAEKYMISDLKNSLARRLMSLLTYDNICSLMNNPACYEALELNASINKILQNETRKVFASPHFLELTSDGFVKILEQEALNVKEVEIWRNAILWAKHKANSEDGGKLREELVKPLKHIRLCTISGEDFQKEVLPTKVLTKDQVVAVGIYIGRQEIQPELTEICSEVEVRKLSHFGCCVKSAVVSKVISLGNRTSYCKDLTCFLETKELGVELSSLTLCSTCYLFASHYFTINIEPVNRPETKTSVAFTTHWLYGDAKIPVSSEERDVVLLPNSLYKISVTSNREFNVYPSSSMPNSDHFSIAYGVNSQGNMSYSIKSIEYKTVNL